MGMDAALNPLEQQLIEGYKKLFKKCPDWAYPVAPAIPFVGNNYPMEGGGVLVYASAENLSYTWPKGEQAWNEAMWQQQLPNVRPWFDPDKDPMLRSRNMLAVSPGTTKVHIEPINNGSLLLAANHALKCAKLNQPEWSSATEFLDHIAVANPGKFSIRSSRNEDYAGNNCPCCWAPSIPFIQNDLMLLRPSVIIAPKSVVESLRHQSIGIDLNVANCKLLPNYQITRGTINRQIKKQLKDLGAPAPAPLNKPDWPLSRGAEKWGMENYLQWIDLVASKWMQPPMPT
jgi:hypothetical protein